MIIPVRCFSCGKVCFNHDPKLRMILTLSWQVVGDLWERYLQLLDEGVADG